MYRASEKTGGEKPIDLIRAPGHRDRGRAAERGRRHHGKGKKALGAMNPLCTLRYSATHVDKHNMVYRWMPWTPTSSKLVKQIEVAAATMQGGNNKPYVKLLAVSNKRGDHGQHGGGREDAPARAREEVTVQDGDDLEQETKRALYADIRMGEIRTAKGDQFMELRCPGSEVYLRPVGEAWGDVDALAVQREMIRRTIKEHLDKEKRCARWGSRC
jgi:type III restriction enzyme